MTPPWPRDVHENGQVLAPQLPRVPTPVGGVPSSIDYTPSCLFVALYALLLPVAIYRLCRRSSRNLIVIFTLGLILERVIFFLIRAWAAHTPDAANPGPTSPGLLAYAQSTLAAGFVSVGRDLVVAVRCLLLRSTFAPPESKSCVPDEEGAASTASIPLERVPSSQKRTTSFADEPPKVTRFSVVPAAAPVVDDSASAGCRGAWWRWMTRERERKVYEAATVCLSIAFVVTIATSLGSGAVYAQGLFAAKYAAETVQLRYISCSLGLLLISLVHMGAYWAWARQPAMGHASVTIVSGICSLLSVIGIYRMVVMGYETDGILSQTSGSLNSGPSKAAFYVFHIAPEWLAVAILVGVNVRERFGLGGRLETSEIVGATVLTLVSV